jgi:hypothetical protein
MTCRRGVLAIDVTPLAAPGSRNRILFDQSPCCSCSRQSRGVLNASAAECSLRNLGIVDAAGGARWVSSARRESFRPNLSYPRGEVWLLLIVRQNITFASSSSTRPVRIQPLFPQASLSLASRPRRNRDAQPDPWPYSMLRAAALGFSSSCLSRVAL